MTFKTRFNPKDDRGKKDHKGKKNWDFCGGCWTYGDLVWQKIAMKYYLDYKKHSTLFDIKISWLGKIIVFMQKYSNVCKWAKEIFLTYIKPVLIGIVIGVILLRWFNN